MNELAHVDQTEVMPDTPAPEMAPTVPADPIVSLIERVVVDPNADLDKLDRMLAMKERVEAKNAKIAFAMALSQARADIPPILKDATVDFKTNKGRTHYKHETLAGIARQIDPILSRNGLSYRWRTAQNGGQITVTCIVTHMNGHAEETVLSGAPDQSGSKNSFQSVGSAVTYLQRYTLKAALGLSAADTDDDGNSAGSGNAGGANNTPRFNPRAAADRVITKLNRCKSVDDLGETWKGEQETISEVKHADAQIYAEIIAIKDRLKGDLTNQERRPSDDLNGDEIPW